MTTTIPKKELVQFIQTLRCDNSETTWVKAADIAHKKYGLVSRFGTPYTGIGFQCFVARVTGQKKWGRQMKPFTKEPFQKRNVVTKDPLLFLAESPKPKSVVAPVKVSPVITPQKPPKETSSLDVLSLVHEVVASDMGDKAKITLVKKLAETLK